MGQQDKQIGLPAQPDELSQAAEVARGSVQIEIPFGVMRLQSGNVYVGLCGGNLAIRASEEELTQEARVKLGMMGPKAIEVLPGVATVIPAMIGVSSVQVQVNGGGMAEVKVHHHGGDGQEHHETYSVSNFIRLFSGNNPALSRMAGTADSDVYVLYLPVKGDPSARLACFLTDNTDPRDVRAIPGTALLGPLSRGVVSQVLTEGSGLYQAFLEGVYASEGFPLALATTWEGVRPDQVAGMRDGLIRSALGSMSEESFDERRRADRERFANLHHDNFGYTAWPSLLEVAALAKNWDKIGRCGSIEEARALGKSHSVDANDLDQLFVEGQVGRAEERPVRRIVKKRRTIKPVVGQQVAKVETVMVGPTKPPVVFKAEVVASAVEPRQERVEAAKARLGAEVVSGSGRMTEDGTRSVLDYLVWSDVSVFSGDPFKGIEEMVRFGNFTGITDYHRARFPLEIDGSEKQKVNFGYYSGTVKFSRPDGSTYGMDSNLIIIWGIEHALWCIGSVGLGEVFVARDITMRDGVVCVDSSSNRVMLKNPREAYGLKDGSLEEFESRFPSDIRDRACRALEGVMSAYLDMKLEHRRMIERDFGDYRDINNGVRWGDLLRRAQEGNMGDIGRIIGWYKQGGSGGRSERDYRDRGREKDLYPGYIEEMILLAEKMKATEKHAGGIMAASSLVGAVAGAGLTAWVMVSLGLIGVPTIGVVTGAGGMSFGAGFAFGKGWVEGKIAFSPGWRYAGLREIIIKAIGLRECPDPATERLLSYFDAGKTKEDEKELGQVVSTETVASETVGYGARSEGDLDEDFGRGQKRKQARVAGA